MSIEVQLPQNHTLERMVIVQNNPELLARVKMGMLLAASKVIDSAKAEQLSNNAIQLIEISKRITKDEAYREQNAKIIISAGIVRGIFPNTSEPPESYTLPANIDASILGLIELLINDIELIGIIN